MIQTSLVDILYGIIPVLSLVVGLFIGRAMERRTLEGCASTEVFLQDKPEDDVMLTDPWNVAVYGERKPSRKPTMKGEQ